MAQRKKIFIGTATGEPEQPVQTGKKLPGGKWSVLVSTLLVTVVSFCIGWYANGLIGQAEPVMQQPTMTELSKADLWSGVSQKAIIRKSSTPEKMLSSLGVERTVIESLMSDIEFLGVDSIYAGHKLNRIYSDSTRETLNKIEYHADDSEVYRLTLRPYPAVEKLRIPVRIQRKVYSGIIAENIWLEILESPELHHDLIPLLENAVKWTVDIFHLSPGDRFKLIYTERIIGGEVTGVDQLEAVSIRTMGVEGRTYDLYSWRIGEEEIFLDEKGVSVRNRFLKAPVKFAIVSSPYSKARKHPVTGEVKRHNGTDFAAPQGAPIVALADGKIEKANFDKFNGNNVRIIHNDRQKTQYLHMSEFARGITRGALVKQGQVIGYVGSTGLSTGPHVCLRFWQDGTQVDFFANESSDNFRLPQGEVSDFLRKREELDKEFDRVSLSGL